MKSARQELRKSALAQSGYPSDETVTVTRPTLSERHDIGDLYDVER